MKVEQATGLGGVDAIQLSNHGGRQLDRAVAPVELIAPVREAVGPTVTLLVDSGIRHGADLVVALALGADAGVLGRAYVYGLMAGGEAGVDRALDVITEQFRRTMQLLGVTTVSDLRKNGRELLTRGYGDVRAARVREADPGSGSLPLVLDEGEQVGVEGVLVRGGVRQAVRGTWVDLERGVLDDLRRQAR